MNHRDDPLSPTNAPPVEPMYIGPIDAEVIDAEVASEASIVVAKPAGNRGHAVIAWLTILAVAGTVIGLQMFGRRSDVVEQDGAASLNDSVLEFQGKMLVGWKAMNSSLGAPSEIAKQQQADLYRQAHSLDQGPFASRLRFVVLAGELAGPEEAAKKIEAIDESTAKGDADLVAALATLYSDHARGAWDSPSLSAEERNSIGAQLGWFGELALAPEKGPNRAARDAVIAPAKTAFLSIMVAGFVALVVGTAGVAGAGLFAVLVAARRVTSSIETPSGNGGVYAETFALWLVVYLGASFATGVFYRGEPPLTVLVASFLSGLLVLAWPVLRGIPWAQVRRDIGWTAGRSPLLEPIYGIVGYICGLPLMLVGVMLVALLMSIANWLTGGEAAKSPPAHPVTEWVEQGGWGQIVMIFLLASVCAPLIEETFFRGVLYRHLRDATWRWRIGASMLFSGLANGVLFASLHPQGLLAVPALASIALGLSLQREWRGSLVAPMVSHGLNNAVVLTLLLVVTS